jgi:predicted transcriptional regulator
MYHAFVTYEQLKNYLPLLIENGLLNYDKTTNKCMTTGKGTRFLKLIDQMEEAMQRRQLPYSAS